VEVLEDGHAQTQVYEYGIGQDEKLGGEHFCKGLEQAPQRDTISTKII